MLPSNISKLLSHRVFYEDPRIEMYSKQEGVVKKKKETTILLGTNPGSLKKLFKFHKKGRILAYYDDCPLKADSRPGMVLCIQDIKELEENAKNKSGHFKLVMADEQMELKIDDINQLADWVKAINFFRDYYSKEKPLRPRSYKEEVDVEMQLQLMAENELSTWESIKSKYDYSSFCKDKNFIGIFTSYPLNMLTNRILISSVKKKTEYKKEATDVKNTPNQNQGRTNMGPKNPSIQANMSLDSPSALTNIKNKIAIFDKIDSFGSKNFIAFLVSQRPVSEIDEEQYFKDHKAISRDGFPFDLDFNTIYLYQYTGSGDTKPAHKKISVKYFH
jgi:hypothetical protein